MNSLLETKIEMQKKMMLGSNYIIQIYSGSLSDALNYMSNFKRKFSEWSSTIKYEEPNYKVWVGNFGTRLIADRALLKIESEFQEAFVFKPIIKL